MPTQTPQNPLVGMAWMVVTGLCFVGMTAFVKLLGSRIPAGEAAFLRYLIGLVFLIPMWRDLAAMRLTRRQWGLAAGRGAVHTLGVVLWFYAMTRLPMAEVTAMNYMTPVYVSLLAVVFLGERLAIRRILAMLAALIGVLIILRPGFRTLDGGHFAMLGTALFFSVSYLLAKIQSGELPASMVVALLSITVSVGLAPMAVMDWVAPNLWDLVLLAGIACFATAGHFTMTKAFASAPVTVTQPITFLQLIWSVGIGAVFFHEAIDYWVILGGIVILSAATFIAWRESVLNRKIMPPMNAAKF
ncbi:DMT family transporter [Pseudoprimorskyibacter insulae]|uniref:Riboflavin transporter n=1 Tax=Pseudoprimorskyibacter insulae TaxID=1695997 RepID=A0A2R8AQL8_9RHOB|nr:DMT family transporter [Pseudoprimorskyibacter insulae]SPF78315.1 Riboflavin transporter [Pseudoprimorskyibacter insulae]